MTNFDCIEEKIHYKFNDKKLLKQALTHRSYANDIGCESYERLEFLGDAIIEMIVSDFIYRYLDVEVGVLTKLRAALVSTEYLNNISRELELDKLALKSKSLSQLSKKNIADLFESLIGAVYIDGGIDNAKLMINRFIIKDMENIRFALKHSVDYKTLLQEYMQGCAKCFEYKVISSSGLDHEKKHTIGLWVEGDKIIEFTANSKHEAEEKCAEFYMKKFVDNSMKN